MRPAQNRAMPDSPQPKLLLSRAMSALTGRGPFASHSTTDAVGHNGSDGDSPAFPLVRTLLEPPAGIDRRPHPYHGTTRNRCAERRYRRSRSTVGAKVMGSPSAKGSAHFPATLFASERLPQPAHRTGPVPLPRSAARSGGRYQPAEQYGSSAHRRTAASAAPRTAAPSTSTRDGGIPRSGHTQTKASGPGGGRGRTR